MKIMLKFVASIVLSILISLSTKNVVAQYWGTGSNSNVEYVEGYYRDDGTYVEGYYRTERNEYNLDNFNAKGNYNPYTGETGDKTYSSPYNSLYNGNDDYEVDYSNDYSNSNNEYSYENNYQSEYNNSYTPSSSYYTRSSAIRYHDRYSFSTKLTIEKFLENNGFSPGQVDGVFTEQTISAIKSLQRYIGVTSDGKFGPNTLKRVKTLSKKDK